MRLREFVDSFDKKYEEPERGTLRKNDETAIPNEGEDEKGNPIRGPVKVTKNKCSYCKLPINKEDKWFGDKDGNVYHKDCYDKISGNKEQDVYGGEYPENLGKEEIKAKKTEKRIKK